MANRHLDLAAQHVSDAWFPVNDVVLSKIRAGLNAGSYDHDIELLILEIRGDFSLFMYCLKELASQVSSTTTKQALNPFERLRQAGVNQLKAILSDTSRTISVHSFDSLSKTQALRLQQSMLSASVAQVLADNAEIDGEVGFSCGLLRQLGLTLIAWNYPHVYTRALSSLSTSTKSLDVALQKILGFSPALLGIALAREWKLPLEVLIALGDSSALTQLQGKALSPEDELAVKKAQIAGETLAKFCKVGEALARSNDPEHYPTALTDWNEAESAIRNYLGENGIAKIQQAVKANCAHYISKVPDAFNLSFSANNTKKIESSNYARELLERNSYVKNLPPLLKMQVSEVYSRIAEGHISRENVDKVIKDVLPCAGFEDGCIFMLEPYSLSLVPVLKFGKPNSELIHTVKLSAPSGESDPVATAYRCTAPIKEEVPGIDAPVTFIAGALGNTQKAGVLYLEISSRLDSKSGSDPMLYFKAVRQCLIDCLNLG